MPGLVDAGGGKGIAQAGVGGALALPTACIRTRIQGPRPASRVEPVSVPTGMDSSLVDTSDRRRRISSAIWDRRRLKAAMLLSSAATRPLSSFSRWMSTS